MPSFRLKPLLFVGVFFVLGLFTVSANACQTCYEYYDYQSLTWCPFCDEANCGFFNCHLEDVLWSSTPYCTGDDYGCFTTERHCPQEPQVELPKRLEDSWRLGRVRVSSPPQKTVLPLNAAAL